MRVLAIGLLAAFVLAAPPAAAGIPYHCTLKDEWSPARAVDAVASDPGHPVFTDPREPHECYS